MKHIKKIKQFNRTLYTEIEFMQFKWINITSAMFELPYISNTNDYTRTF